MNSDELFGDLLIQGTKKTGLNIGIISNIKDKNYKILVSAINDHVTSESDSYSIKKGNEFALSDTYCSNVFRESKTKYYMDVENFSSLLKHPCYLSHQLRAYIGTPIILNGEVYGTLNYSSLKPRLDHFSKEDISFVESQAVEIAEMLK